MGTTMLLARNPLTRLVTLLRALRIAIQVSDKLAQIAADSRHARRAGHYPHPRGQPPRLQEHRSRYPIE